MVDCGRNAADGGEEFEKKIVKLWDKNWQLCPQPLSAFITTQTSKTK